MVPGYLGSSWFHDMRAKLPYAAGPTDLDEIVMFRVASSESSTFVHHLGFVRGELATWTDGPPPAKRAKVTAEVHRPMAVDWDDFANIAGERTDSRTVVRLLSDSSSYTDVFGCLPRACRHVGPVCLSEGTTIVLGLSAQDGPFGPVSMSKRVGMGGLSAADAQTPPDLSIEGPYEAILRWIHDPEYSLGELMLGDTRVSGEMCFISAVDGVVSSPADESVLIARGRVERLIHLRALMESARPITSEILANLGRDR